MLVICCFCCSAVVASEASAASSASALYSALEEVGLVPNRSKFKIFAVDDNEGLWASSLTGSGRQTQDLRWRLKEVAHGPLDMELLGEPIGHVCL